MSTSTAAAQLLARHVDQSLTIAWMNAIVKQQIPVIASQVLLVTELVRKVCVDFRMINRARKRGRPNLSELLYFTIKIFALGAVLTDIMLQESNSWTSGRACYATSKLSDLLWYLSSTWVAVALAWRTYVIFGRSVVVLRILCCGLACQIALVIASVAKAHAYKATDRGYCDYSLAQHVEEETTFYLEWYQLASPWLIFVNLVFDASTVVASTWKLIASARGPLGFSELAKVLVTNGVQYAALVGTTNLIEFSLVMAAYHTIPSLLNLSITVQVIAGLGLIAQEQDEVHGYSRSTSSARHGQNKFDSHKRMRNGRDVQFATMDTTEGVIKMSTVIDIVDDDPISLREEKKNETTTPTPTFEVTMPPDSITRCVPTPRTSLQDRPQSYFATSAPAPATPTGVEPRWHNPGNITGEPAEYMRGRSPLETASTHSGSQTPLSGVSIRSIREAMMRNTNQQARDVEARLHHSMDSSRSRVITGPGPHY
ncbi:hypothetical protein OC846_005010 [Tilletia horrida]|uniref:Uncharacterized protein n=1 Tax=Tilletia horrida TaxID=155126 RepID=A0AAN6GM49_9BASI|nr:hypothetical protein OC846_005010 [Tilletia horrida]